MLGATPRSPAPLALLMLVYFAVMLVGMSLYGVEPWVRNADAFGVLFGLIGSLAPLGRGDDGRSSCASRGRGRARLDPIAGTGVLLVISVGSTAFDGAKEGPLFNDIVQELQSCVRLDLGFSLGRRSSRVPRRAGGGGRGRRRDLALGMRGHVASAVVPDRRALARAFTHTLIPISAGYMVAHYFSLLAYNGQNLWPLANDPLGDGKDLFGGAAAEVDYGVVSARPPSGRSRSSRSSPATSPALVLAHDRALEVYGSRPGRDSLAGVMLGLMVAFTCWACGCCRRR